MSPELSPPARSGLRPGPGVAVALLSFLIVLLGVFADTRMVRTEVWRVETQPASVEYDGSTYHAGLLHRESWLLRRRLPDAIMVGRYPDMGYGHPVYFEITGTGDPALDSARWGPEGVWAHLDSGHEIFVPASAFTGGR
ncbi:hypothetical protein [Nocardia sp. NBC_01329]|uniref:hypothetical protein n=1 Tax=Nocardia sp. NBC_01329 TaxID=2903594 RepID=UPI002E142785|nr:hypothetical protein OG405_27930 [Nocardia sp. NBC_01329]